MTHVAQGLPKMGYVLSNRSSFDQGSQILAILIGFQFEPTLASKIIG